MTITPIEPPANIDYGWVFWQAATDIRDGSDPGQQPDYVPPTGTVSFVSSVGKLLDAGATPNPITIIRDVIIGVVDEEGYLCTPDPVTEAPMYRGVQLIANDDPDLNPQNSVYNVSYQLKSGRTGKTLKYPEPHQIVVLAGESLDLTNFIEPDDAQVIGLPQANALAAAAAASAAAAEARAVSAEESAANAEAALVDSDGFIADQIATPGSATEGALAAKIETGLAPVQEQVDERVELSGIENANRPRAIASVMPPGAKMRGLNIVPTDQGSVSGSWAAWWRVFPWANSIKPQIDLSKALGANTIRWMGGFGAITETGQPGRLTLDQYLARFEQVVTYCEQQGLYVTVALDAYGHRSDRTNAQSITYATETAKMLNRHANVVYLDLSNELLTEYVAVNGGTTNDALATVTAMAAALYSAVKAVTRIPCGFSHTYGFGTSDTQSYYAALMPFCDAIDLHNYDYGGYGRLVAQTQIQQIMAGYPGKPLLMTEFGNEYNPADSRYTTANGGAAGHLAATRSIFNFPGVDGGCMFSIVDIGTGTPTHWTGIYSDESAATVRSVARDGFKTLPAAPQRWEWSDMVAADTPIADGNLVTLKATTITFTKPTLVTVQISVDLRLPTPNTSVYELRASVDGGAVLPVEGSPSMIHGEAPGRTTLNRRVVYALLPGSHTFRLFAQRLTGTDTNAVVQAGRSGIELSVATG